MVRAQWRTGHIKERYRVEASPSVISAITGAVMEFKLVCAAGQTVRGGLFEGAKRDGLAKPAAGAVLSDHSAGHRGAIHDVFSASYMDAIRVNIRSDGAVSNKAVFVALAILPDGTRGALG